MQIAVGEVHFFASDDRRLFAQIFRTDPVERQIRKGSLRSPARRDVQVVNEFLKMLFDFFVFQIVFADKGRQIRVNRRKRLRSGPFVLQRSQKVNHLSQSGSQMFGNAGFDFARNTVQSFLQQSAQRPPGAIAGQHVQIVNVKIAVAVRFAGRLRVNVGKPVIGNDFTRYV